MKISRRKFLGGAPIAVLSSGLILELANSVTAQKFGTERIEKFDISKDALSKLNLASFLPYVTTDFAFRSESGRIVYLQLAKMDDVKANNPRLGKMKGENFSLSFVGSLKQQLTQDVYQVEHFALGSFTLLISVVGRNKRGWLYEAIINRLEP